MYRFQRIGVSFERKADAPIGWKDRRDESFKKTTKTLAQYRFKAQTPRKDAKRKLLHGLRGALIMGT
jgi:hypothetical protein